MTLETLSLFNMDAPQVTTFDVLLEALNRLAMATMGPLQALAFTVAFGLDLNPLNPAFGRREGCRLLARSGCVSTAFPESAGRRRKHLATEIQSATDSPRRDMNLAFRSHNGADTTPRSPRQGDCEGWRLVRGETREGLIESSQL
jgi:hypothetical protein